MCGKREETAPALSQAIRSLFAVYQKGSISSRRFRPTPKNAPPGCIAGRFCLAIEALRRYAVAGGALSFPVDRGELASRRTDARRAYRGVHTADGSEG